MGTKWLILPYFYLQLIHFILKRPILPSYTLSELSMLWIKIAIKAHATMELLFTCLIAAIVVLVVECIRFFMDRVIKGRLGFNFPSLGTLWAPSKRLYLSFCVSYNDFVSSFRLHFKRPMIFCSSLLLWTVLNFNFECN